MKQLLKQIPIPMSGLMLALFSITKLTVVFEQAFLSAVFFILGVITWVLLMAKIIFAWHSVKQDLQNPIIASVAPTFTMGTMVFANIVAQITEFAAVLWLAAFIAQLALIIFFVRQFVWKKRVELTAVYPSWFILFVGLGIVPVTAGTIFPWMSQIIFYAVVISYIALLPVVLFRLSQFNLDDGVKPLVVILAAPGSLCLVGYLQTFTLLNNTVITSLFILSQILYVIVVSKLPKLVTLPFYPSFAAFTFPLVISATAAVRMSDLTDSVIVQVIANIEFIVAIVVVFYVVARYIVFFKKLVIQQWHWGVKYH